MGSKATGRGNSSLIEMDNENKERRVEGSPWFCRGSDPDHGVLGGKWNTTLSLNLCVRLKQHSKQARWTRLFSYHGFRLHLDGFSIDGRHLEELISSLCISCPTMSLGSIGKLDPPQSPISESVHFTLLQAKNLEGVFNKPSFSYTIPNPSAYPAGSTFENRFRTQPLFTSSSAIIFCLGYPVEQVPQTEDYCWGAPSFTLHSHISICCGLNCVPKKPCLSSNLQ